MHLLNKKLYGKWHKETTLLLQSQKGKFIIEEKESIKFVLSHRNDFFSKIKKKNSMSTMDIKNKIIAWFIWK